MHFIFRKLNLYVFFVLIAYINFLLEYPEKKEINRKSQQTVKNQKNHKRMLYGPAGAF